jgi:hypothetical protein
MVLKALPKTIINGFKVANYRQFMRNRNILYTSVWTVLLPKGGMDFIMRYRAMECLRNGEPLDILYLGAISLSNNHFNP